MDFWRLVCHVFECVCIWISRQKSSFCFRDDQKFVGYFHVSKILRRYITSMCKNTTNGQHFIKRFLSTNAEANESFKRFTHNKARNFQMKTSQISMVVLYYVLIFIGVGEIARKPFDICVSVWLKRKPYELVGFLG